MWARGVGRLLTPAGRRSVPVTLRIWASLDRGAVRAGYAAAAESARSSCPTTAEGNDGQVEVGRYGRSAGAGGLHGPGHVSMRAGSASCRSSGAGSGGIRRSGRRPSMPGGTDESASAEFEVWAAQRIVDQHEGVSRREDGRRICASARRRAGAGTLRGLSSSLLGRAPGWRREVERELTPTQIRNRLILAVRAIAGDHAPVDGHCPVCRVTGCSAALVAVAYLEQHGTDAQAPGLQYTPAVRRPVERRSASAPGR